MLTYVHNSSPRELKTGGILCGLCGQPTETKWKFPDLCEKFCPCKTRWMRHEKQYWRLNSSLHTNTHTHVCTHTTLMYFWKCVFISTFYRHTNRFQPWNLFKICFMFWLSVTLIWALLSVLPTLFRVHLILQPLSHFSNESFSRKKFMYSSLTHLHPNHSFPSLHSSQSLSCPPFPFLFPSSFSDTNWSKTDSSLVSFVWFLYNYYFIFPYNCFSTYCFLVYPINCVFNFSCIINLNFFLIFRNFHLILKVESSQTSFYLISFLQISHCSCF